ncbi:MAG TPA: hypothetical protein VEY87_01720 [Gaiellaceae bacterium]|nr:hypothetical protein [Gaiellaceae bacterium]
MHAADTLTQIALHQHRERTAPHHVVDRGFPQPTHRFRAAAALRRLADRLDAGYPETASMRPLTGRG